MQLYQEIQNALNKYQERNAFLINGIFYKYADFSAAISRIRKAIEATTLITEKNIGLVANDDLDTYASIIALWLEGKAYVPISPETPRDRNENIIKQACLETIIDSSATVLFSEYKLIESKKIPATPINLIPKNVTDQDLVYILFTSGTTGQPKGVPITIENLTGFVTAFDKMELDINENDRCLQMFELTFDLSVMSYLLPLLKGACIYTIPKDKIKYSYIYELMDDQELTFALMVPSILHFLRPYFKEIDLPKMKYSLFCGEALPEDVTKEWSRCLPNAKILNVYGPTEDTIFCTEFTFSRTGKNKSRNGILSIGKSMEGTTTIIINEDNQPLPWGNVGQLCLGGIQLTPGYWNNETKNAESFFFTAYNGKQERFYKTGDLCLCDEEGDIEYLGRIDFQIKIQGFRVELSEIEFHVKSFLERFNVVAVAYEDVIGNTEIGLAIEAKEFDTISLQEYMKTKMPAYMIPREIIFVPIFPLNSNGKTDRNALGRLFKKA
jgi:D-alanine--poly(phosphoribitol) ligase subunit 1